MCLWAVDETFDKPVKMTAWKFFRKDYGDKKFYAPYFPDRGYKEGKMYVDPESDVIHLPGKPQHYKTGFHAYKTREAARKLARHFAGTGVVRKIALWVDTSGRNINGAAVLVGRKMYIHER